MVDKKKRIVVTGMGVVSCFGSDVDEFYQRMVAGESGVSMIDQFECADYPTRFAAPVRDFNPEGYIDRKQARRLDPAMQYAIVAGKKAAEQAGMTDEVVDSFDKERCGVLIGSGMGGMHVYTEGAHVLAEKGVSRLSPFFVPFIITNMSGALLAIDLGFMGPNYSVSTACATASYAVVQAANHIRRGDADVMICGGTEAAILPICLAGFCACRAMSVRNDDPQGAARPWDKDRDGFVLGSGAGVVVLETLEHALERGAPILAEYHGGGYSCDANHMTNPREDGAGIAMCIDHAMRDAQMPKERVNFISAHATCTPLGDQAEYLGIRRYFGDHRKNIKMNAPKSMIGHSLGAAGGHAIVAGLQCLRHGRLHPTINHHKPDDYLDMDVVPNVAQDHDVDLMCVNAFGFGGHNSCVVFGHYDE